MVYRRATFASVLALMIGSASSVMAADIYAPSAGSLKDPVVSEEVIIPEATTFPENAEWYIRGDLGVGWFGDTDITATYSAGPFAVTGNDFNTTFSGSVGFGRYLTPNIRMGVDVDYRHDNSTRLSTSDPYAPAIMDGMSGHRLEINTIAVMANFVYNFRPNHRFSPYIGGGIGWASHNLTLKGGSYDSGLNLDGNAANGTETINLESSSSTSNSFAANFVTGVSVRMRDNLFLDLGYRMTYMGDASTSFRYSYNNGTPTPTTGSGSLELKDLLTHEIKIGLRYDLY